jgi:hypothetical protein
MYLQAMAGRGSGIYPLWKKEVFMDANKVMRKELLALLGGGNAHMDFEDAVSGFPPDKINTLVPGSSYLVWHVLFHMQVVQWDILEFIRNPGHESPDFPDGYWPGKDEPAIPARWDEIVRKYLADRRALEDMVKAPAMDLFSPIPHARDYTVFREILLAADHNAFHMGEIVALRRILNLNPVKEY